MKPTDIPDIYAGMFFHSLRGILFRAVWYFLHVILFRQDNEWLVSYVFFILLIFPVLILPEGQLNL